ncbi:MAG TPA: acyl-CoA dehydrogenase family protein [Acidimicrobiales bacterium]|nr:acyl-CoA dehydrogenase family protein [Acidimicrobiales bacterium]
MDFSFTEEQDAVRELAARILNDLSTPERLKEVEAGDERIDRKLWAELGSAGLLGVALPESCGGAGLGFLAAAIVAEEIGRHAGAVPFTASVVLGAGPIAEFGSEQQQQRWLPGVVAGDTILTGALVEPGADPWKPTLMATRDGDNWRLDGVKAEVPVGMIADAMVVSARTEDGGAALFIVDPSTAGVTRSRQETTSWQFEAEIEFAGVTVGADGVLVAGDEGEVALEWLLERAATAYCLEVSGACQAAVKLTAAYTTEREQFGKPIATFQAVGQRAADAYIDTEAVRLTSWQAAWRLAEGLPAAAEVAVAKYWADEGAQRAVHGAQHLHGGVGVDRDYPLHRHFLRTKHLALTLGGTTPSLLRLGHFLATEPV